MKFHYFNFTHFACIQCNSNLIIDQRYKIHTSNQKSTYKHAILFHIKKKNVKKFRII